MKRQKLGDACSRLSSGKSIRASEINSAGSYPVIGGNGLRGYADHFNFDGECAVIGRQGAACGNIRFHSGKAYITEHAVVAVADECNDSRYLAYLLSTMRLGRLSAQSAQPGLSVKTLSKQEVDLPSLEVQKQVVRVLGALDDKIEANAKLNGYIWHSRTLRCEGSAWAAYTRTHQALSHFSSARPGRTSLVTSMRSISSSGTFAIRARKAGSSRSVNQRPFRIPSWEPSLKLR